MSENKTFAKVWEEDIVIPTYPVGEPNKNPMFLENRVYQGSSGVVYPHPVIDKLSDEKEDVTYRALFLENEYIKIMIMPCFGGRVQMGYDKTNGYHFVYYNQVVKPALVGLLGAWCSGGIEFNWPQTHRPSTYQQVDYTIEENSDGSVTAWIAENERMFRTRGMNGYTLYPDKAYLEIKGRFYNRTSVPQHFMMWANPSVHVNENYQSLFPPDVDLMFDHAKRDSTKWPVATGEYYKIDYSEGVDLSWFKNTPVPNSFMACPSNYNFLGGYDHGKSAGMIHVADRHFAPGKKMWTWGNGNFGDVWCNELTDEDGAYNELMAGIYTDNQPDFSWLQPGERREYVHYFMPFKGIAGLKNATIDGALNLELSDGKAVMGAYVTGPGNYSLKLSKGPEVLFEDNFDLSPEDFYEKEIDMGCETEITDLCLCMINSDGKEIVRYAPAEELDMPKPEVSKETPLPELIRSNDELYLTGLHLEQYRHVTYQPEWYYLEALKRDAGDYKCNIAMGLHEYRKGKFIQAIEYFNKAVKRLTTYNQNPAAGEVYYHRGWAYLMNGEHSLAYESFYKAVWNGEWRGEGYFELARVASLQGDTEDALGFVDTSLLENADNLKALHLRAVLLRKLGRTDEAADAAEKLKSRDILDFGAMNELFLCGKTDSGHITDKMRNDAHNYIELAIDYGLAGFYDDAVELLERLENNVDELYPMVLYYKGYYQFCMGDSEAARASFEKAETMPGDYCWPNRIESVNVLKIANELNPAGANAFYYLGCYWNHMREYDSAIQVWEISRELNASFPTVWRNLALAYFNKKGDTDKARTYLEKAYSLDESDGRILLELDQLYKSQNMKPENRLKLLEKHMDVVMTRDDLYLERLCIYNLLGDFGKAYDLLMQYRFHAWEGGEGKVAGQYIFSLVELAKIDIENGKTAEAVKKLEAAKVYPENLGEGKLDIQPENNINYTIGLAYEKAGNETKAREYFELAAGGSSEMGNALAYNDLPPDMAFYQGMAFRKLGFSGKSKGCFNRLIDFGKDHQDDEVGVPFFIYSLQDFLIFDVDYTKNNKTLCHYLKGLGYLGLDDRKKARNEFAEVFKLNLYHHDANIFFRMLK